VPLVRIALRKGRPADFGRRVGEVVYRAMVETIAVPANDHFQVISEHDGNGLVYDPGYFGITRTDGMVFIQITLSEGRTLEQKRALYRVIAANLHAELGVRPEDVFINLIEVKKENWSFGNGVASYAPRAVEEVA
jgi:phenylpyruvate tautomerase PptA (4-oxalocrotonate tautomerase family)